MITLIPFDHKSKMRLIEHGDLWSIVTPSTSVQFASGKWTLVEAKDGHLKWWKTECVIIT